MIRLSLQQTNRPLDTVTYWRDKGFLMLDTPYQRGDVWGETRQRNFIKSLLMGIPIPSIIINDRSRTGTWPEAEMWKMAVIDGKQRLTAILKFFDSNLDVTGEWFGRGTNMKCYCDLDQICQRRFQNLAIPFSEGSLGSLEEEREVFELVNFGGVPQGETDLP